MKSTLRLLIPRLRMSQQKDTAVSVAARREMARLLENGKEASARIRVENIIHTDITVELLEILELYCELLLARANLLDANPPDHKAGAEPYIDPGLEEATASLIYAAPRMPRDVKEMAVVRGLLVERWGKEFAKRAQDNTDGLVPDRVAKKLRVEPPSQELVTLYLKEIARTYRVPWPKEDYEEQEAVEELQGEVDNEDRDDDGEGGGGKEAPLLAETPKKKADLGRPFEREELSRATPPRDIGDGAKSPVSVAPPAARIDNPSPKVKIPGEDGKKAEVEPTVKKAQPAPAKKDVVEGKIPDVDELAKRFAALKK